jgi:hypothetical protein
MPASGGWVSTTQTAELGAAGGNYGDVLGTSVAVSGSTIVAGAPDHTNGSYINADDNGEVYVWTKPAAGAWVNAIQTASLTASDSGAQDLLGGSVAISGSTIVAGAPGRGAGAVYVWTLPVSGTWTDATQTAELTTNDPSAGYVGESVAVVGPTIFAGGGPGITTFHGVVYEWTLPYFGVWVDATQTAKLTPSDSAGGDEFGSAIAASGSTLAVGSPSLNTPGAAYVFGGGLTVSGTVYGRQCENGCAQPGIPGVTVLVKGTASDGSAVSQTDKTDGAGNWSVVLPPGSYTAAPTQDGVTFEPGFDPAQRQVTVTNANIPGQNFVGCVETGASSDLRERHQDADRLRGHAAPAGTVDLCHSVYTFRLSAILPNSRDAGGSPLPNTEFGGSYLVDPSSQARYNTRSDPRFNDFRPASGLINYVSHTAPFRQVFLKGREYPACMSEKQIEELDNAGLTGRQVDWYSYISGTSLGSYSVQLSWNQSNQKLALVGSPAATRGWLYRVFNWTAGDDHGSCYTKAKAQLVVLPVIRGNQFTIAVAWGIPFVPTGVTAEDSELIRKLVDRNFEYWGKKLNTLKGNIADTYKAAPEGAKFALELAIAALGAKTAFSLIEMGPAEIRTLAGALTEDEALAAIKYADYFHIGHTIGELINFLGAFGGEYPVMTALIRGQFHNNPLPAGFSGPTQLGISTGATKFPNITFLVSRDAYDLANAKGQHPYSGVLPWGPNRFENYADPAVANRFRLDDYFLLNQVPSNAYFASGANAVNQIEEDTKALPGIKTSIQDGNLGVDFNSYKSEVGAPPSCALSGGFLYATAAPAHALCWVFGDGRA